MWGEIAHGKRNLPALDLWIACAAVRGHEVAMRPLTHALTVLGLVLAGCGGGSASGAAPSAGATPTPSPSPSPSSTPTGRPQVVFADEFNSASLDRGVWNVVGPDFWVNSEQQAYFDSPDTILLRQGVADADGGVLTLRVVFSPGTDTLAARGADFISGRIDSSNRFDFQHGRAEARIRMSDAVGFWPAFWLLGYSSWPDSGEIDIMEYVGEREWTSSAMHGPGYSGDTPLAARHTFAAGTDASDWHTYAVEWSADAVTFEVDGAAFYTVTKTEVEKYGAWKFDNAKYIILNAAIGGAYPNGVNSVTTPYFGVPQETVDKVTAGNVQMDVDWVRVTQVENAPLRRFQP
jgi:beta-glucanase (GH16 family)